ncbi:unnamed protein product [Camellia sinensis]
MAVGVLALQGSFNEHIAVLRRLGVKGVEIRKPEQLQSVTSLIIPGGESTTMAKLAEYHNLFPSLREFVKMGKPVWGTCAGLIFLANKASGQKTGGQELVGGLDCTVHRNFFGSQIQSFEAELLVPSIAAKEGGPPTFRGVFIRAPAILEVGPDVEVLADILVPSNKTVDPNSTLDSQESHDVKNPLCTGLFYMCWMVYSLWGNQDQQLMKLIANNFSLRAGNYELQYIYTKESTGTADKVIVAVKQGNLLGTAFHPELTADTRWHSYFLKMVGEVVEGASSSSIVAVGEEFSFYQQPKIDLPIFQ